MRPLLLFCVLAGSGMLSLAQSPPAPRFIPPPSPGLNIGGIWQQQVRINNGSLVVVKIRINQTGNAIKAELTETDSSVNGRTIFEGHFTDKLVIVGRSPDSQSTPQNPQWYEDRLLIVDPDHIHFEKINMEMARASVHADDIPCDSGNSYHVTPNFALVRGASAIIELKDARKAACWLNIGAAQGNSRSQSMLAYLLYAGNGVGRDYNQAFAWAQQSAAQNDLFGEMILAALYEEGKGVATDAQKASYWTARASKHPEYEAMLAQQKVQEQRRQQPSARPTPQLSPQQIRQGVTAVVMLGLLFGAIAEADSGSPSGRPSGDGFDEQMNRSYRNMCSGYDSHACGQLGPLERPFGQ